MYPVGGCVSGAHNKSAALAAGEEGPRSHETGVSLRHLQGASRQWAAGYIQPSTQKDAAVAPPGGWPTQSAEERASGWLESSCDRQGATGSVGVCKNPGATRCWCDSNRPAAAAGPVSHAAVRQLTAAVGDAVTCKEQEPLLPYSLMPFSVSTAALNSCVSAVVLVLLQGLIYTAGTMYNILHFFHIPIHVQEVRLYAVCVREWDHGGPRQCVGTVCFRSAAAALHAACPLGHSSCSCVLQY